jgi:protein phosphatase 2C family protein 2/3
LTLLQQNKKMKSIKMRLHDPREGKIRSYAYLTNLGSRIRNEDRVAIATINAQEKTYQYFAVFDGHGGYLTSNYLSLHLHLIVESFLNEDKSPTEALQLALSMLEEKLRKNPRIGSKSGSCALVSLISGDTCWTANVGDSRMLAVSSEAVAQITKDHKP